MATRLGFAIKSKVLAIFSRNNLLKNNLQCFVGIAPPVISYSETTTSKDVRTLTDEEWAQRLTPQQYSVCRQAGTERPFTSDLNDNKAPGKYACACCGQDLFMSETKYNSGSGWPSFYRNIEGSIIERLDTSYDMNRTEVLCSKCLAHLGHVFNDGPEPTGLRYCINGVCLKFKPE